MWNQTNFKSKNNKTLNSQNFMVLSGPGKIPNQDSLDIFFSGLNAFVRNI